MGSREKFEKINQKKPVNRIRNNEYANNFFFTILWTSLALCIVIFIRNKCKRRNNTTRRDSSNINSDSTSNVDTLNTISRSPRKPKTSIILNEILIEKKDGNFFSIINSSVRAFLELCEITELYTLAIVANDDEEAEIRNIINGLKAMKKGLKSHRQMFCSTKMGRTCMIRQLQPMIHIDYDSSIIEQLSGKIPNIAQVKVVKNGNDPGNNEGEKNDSGEAMGLDCFHSLENCVNLLKAVSGVQN